MTNNFTGMFTNNTMPTSSLYRFVPHSNALAANASIIGGRKKYRHIKMKRKTARKAKSFMRNLARMRSQARAMTRNRARNRARSMKGGNNFMQGVIGASTGYSVAGQNLPPSLLALANPSPFTNLSRNL